MFSGLTRGERWILVSLVAVIGIGLAAREVRSVQRQRVFELAEGRKARELTHTPPPSQDPPARALPTEGEKININSALASEFQRIEGIGERKARSIVEDREANGPFRSVDDLDRVKGIGKATVDKFRPFVTVGNEAAGEGSGSRGEGMNGTDGTHGTDGVNQVTGVLGAAGPPGLNGAGAPPPFSPLGPRGSALLPTRTPPEPVVAAPSAPNPASAVPATGRVNINTAGIEELKELSGVGEVLAQRILEYRATHGFFRHPDDLTKVKGIGSKTLEKNRHLITVE